MRLRFAPLREARNLVERAVELLSVAAVDKIPVCGVPLRSPSRSYRCDDRPFWKELFELTNTEMMLPGYSTLVSYPDPAFTMVSIQYNTHQNETRCLDHGVLDRDVRPSRTRGHQLLTEQVKTWQKLTHTIRPM